MDETMTGLHADSDIEHLIQPYSPAFINSTVEKAKADSNSYKVYAWNNTLLSSCVLYQHMAEAHIDLKVENIALEGRPDAVWFVCSEQLQRKDLNKSYWKFLIGCLLLAKLEAASDAKGTRKTEFAAEIGDMYGLASGTVCKYYDFAKAIESIYDKEPSVAESILCESVRISHENTIELTHIDPEILDQIARSIEKKGKLHITQTDMRRETEWYIPKNPRKSRLERSYEVDKNLPIRQMPAYDPDARISTLSYTLPTWIKTINQAISVTDFSKISNSARNRLMKGLDDMLESIDKIQDAINQE